MDYVLVNAVHPMISPPFHYRDDRTATTYERVRESVGSKLIFEETGIQFMPINTIYHLASDVEKSRAILEASDCFLTIGDYFNYLFSGVACVDESLASTTQLYNPRTRSWSERLIERCGIPRKIFPKVVRPGTVLGPLLPEVCAETGLNDVQVIATLFPRHRRGGRRGARARRRLGISFFGHLVADRRRTGAAPHQRRRFAHTISPTRRAMAGRPDFSRISSAFGSSRNRAGFGQRRVLELDYASLTEEAE